MIIGNVMGWIVLVLLALYGCAQLIRCLCLWIFRCPQCALCCRMAVPQEHAAVAPLARCLQAQTVWEDSFGCRCTVMLLPSTTEETTEELERIFSECPAVIPITIEGLQEWLQQVTRSENRDGSGDENCI